MRGPALRALHCLLVAVLLAASASSAYAASRADAKSHQRKADNARRQAEAADRDASRMAGEIGELDRRIESATQKVLELQPEVDRATDRRRRLDGDVTNLSAEVAQIKKKVQANAGEYDRVQALFSKRVNADYRQGEWFYLEVLLGAKDFSDLVLRSEFVARVIESDNALASALDEVGRQLERDRVMLERKLRAVETKQAEAATAEATLRDLQSERRAVVQGIAVAKRERESMMAATKANAKRLRALADAEEAESRRIAAELAQRGGSGGYGGRMTWPVPSSHRVTSPYGWRTCPYHGRELHPAIDIGAPQGSSIVAAAEGEVIYVGYRGSYGNTVMIDHGGGVVTLYPHQAPGAIVVSVGEKVQAGQRIGGVGSTGNATGPHLHFEVRVNGSPQNPSQWL